MNKLRKSKKSIKKSNKLAESIRRVIPELIPDLVGGVSEGMNGDASFIKMVGNVTMDVLDQEELRKKREKSRTGYLPEQYDRYFEALTYKHNIKKASLNYSNQLYGDNRGVMIIFDDGVGMLRINAKLGWIDIAEDERFIIWIGTEIKLISGNDNNQYHIITDRYDMIYDRNIDSVIKMKKID